MLKRIFLSFIALVIFFSLMFSGEYKSGKNVRVVDSVKTDLFVGADYFSISSKVLGDVWAGVGNTSIENAAAENLYIAGGDISIINSNFKSAVILGGDVYLKSDFSGGLKLASGTARVSGTIGQDLIVASGKVIIEKDAVIKGDLVLAGGKVEVYGLVEGNLYGACDNLEIYGTVNKSVDVNIGERLKIDDEAKILGNFSYESQKEFEINRNSVLGNINYTKAIKNDFHFEKFVILVKLFGLLSALIFAMLFIVIAKKQVTSFITALDNYFLVTLAIGFIAIIALPIAIAVLFGLIITIPISLTLLLLACLLFYAGKIFLAIYIGSKLLFLINKKEANIYFAGLTGIIILFGSFFIPYLGIVFYILSSIWGLGISIKFLQHLFTNK